MKPWAFIYISKGANPETAQAVFETEKHKTFIYGVDNIDEACDLARRLVKDGCQLLELCGGFKAEGARKIINAINGAVPVGFIDYFPEELAKLNQT